MRLRLPISHLAALMGAVAAQAVDVPIDYSTEYLYTPDELSDYKSVSGKYAFLVDDFITVSSSSSTWWRSQVLMSGGSFLFTIEDGADPYSLIFQSSSRTAFNVETLHIEDLGDVKFHSIKGSSSDAPIQVSSAFLLRGNSNLTISENAHSYSSYRFDSSGGAIHGGDSSTIELSGTGGDITFSENRVSSTSTSKSRSHGGAIHGGDSSTIELSGTGGDITFSGNRASSNSNSYSTTTNNTSSQSLGGAIYGSDSSSISLSGNSGDITFSGNSSSSSSTSYCAYSSDSTTSYSRSYGGAINGGGYSSISLSGNSGDITFSGNKASANSDSYDSTATTIYHYYSYSYGGAIYGGNNSTIELSGNSGDITFSENSASTYYSTSASAPSSYCAYSYGGAICGRDNSTIELSGNSGDITFSGNSASSTNSSYYSLTNSYGGAIYSGGNVIIQNNGYVLFEKNAEVQEGSYRLRSIYAGGRRDVISLSAAEGRKIEFRDSIYIESSSTFNLNADYTDADGNSIKQTGDIIFTGATTEADLMEVKGSAGTVDEIRLSQTSEVNAMTNLYGGRLRIEDGAIYQGQGVSVISGAGATLVVKDATLDQSVYSISVAAGNTLNATGQSSILAGSLTIAGGSTLSAIGANTITADTITMEVDSCLRLTLDVTNIKGSAVLTTTGTLDMESITLDLVGTEYLTEGKYKLLTRTEAQNYDFTDKWVINDASDGKLSWENGTLYYTGGHDWNHGVTDNNDISDLKEILGNLIINGGDTTITLDDVVQAIEDAVNEGFGHGKGHIVINRGGIHITGEGGLEGHIIFNGDLKYIRELLIDKDITNIKIDLNGDSQADNNVNVSQGHKAEVDHLQGEGSMKKDGKGEMVIHGKGHKVGGKLDVEEGQLTFGGDDESETPHEAEVHELVVGKQDDDKEAKVKVEKDAKLKGDKLHVDGKNAVVTNEGDMEFTEEVKVKDGHLDNRGHISKITLEGGVVSGSGTFAGLTMSGGTLVVGNSPGVMTYKDDLLATDGELVFSVAGTEAATSATSGWEFDTHSQIDMGNCELSLEDVAITIAFGGDMAMAEDGEYSLTLFTYVGNIADFDAEALGVLAENTTFILSTEEGALTANITMMPEISSADYTVQGNNIVLNYTVGEGAIPEPTTATLSLLALAALAARRRRR